MYCADEPRDGPRGARRHGVRGGSALAAILSRQGRPPAANPESLLYSYLTVPRFTAPRWYIEGGAVFMETWMGGGVGRAQGGYDEMVFRAMVRDDAHFYDPLGLASRGAQVDFQIGANAYLYGTRFFTWLAYTYSPEKVVAWIRRDEGSERYYDGSVPAGVRYAARAGLAGLDRVRARVPAAQPRRGAQVPDHAAPQLWPQARSVRFRACTTTRRTGTIYGGFRYPGVVEHVGALNTRDGSGRRLADIKRAMLYRVTSFAYDPASGTAFFTNDNRGVVARPDGGGREDRRGKDAARECADRRDRPSTRSTAR